MRLSPFNFVCEHFSAVHGPDSEIACSVRLAFDMYAKVAASDNFERTEWKFFDKIEDECLLKSEACEALAKANGDRTVVPNSDALNDDALSAGVELWMLSKSATNSANTSQWIRLAGCFDVLGLMAGFLKQAYPDPLWRRGCFISLLSLLAETQSALREASLVFGCESEPTQCSVFAWLRSECDERSIRLDRYMRLDDPASPHEWIDRQERVQRRVERLYETRNQTALRDSCIDHLFELSERLKQAKSSDAEDIFAIVSLVEKLIGVGLPATAIELRQVLEPVLDRIPAEQRTDAFNTVVEQLATAQRPATNAHSRNPRQRNPVHMAAARKKLSTKRVLLVGGNERPHHKRSLIETLGLEHLEWANTSELSPHPRRLEAYVKSGSYDVVLYCTRFTRHVNGAIRRYCEATGTPLVWLPHGMNPTEVAHQVMRQASDRLFATSKKKS